MLLATPWQKCTPLYLTLHYYTVSEKPSTHLFGFRHPAVLLQAADLPLQPQVGLLQLADLLNELADVLQVAQAWTQRVGTRLLRLRKHTLCGSVSTRSKLGYKSFVVLRLNFQTVFGETFWHYWCSSLSNWIIFRVWCQHWFIHCITVLFLLRWKKGKFPRLPVGGRNTYQCMTGLCLVLHSSKRPRSGTTSQWVKTWLARTWHFRMTPDTLWASFTCFRHFRW